MYLLHTFRDKLAHVDCQDTATSYFSVEVPASPYFDPACVMHLDILYVALTFTYQKHCHRCVKQMLFTILVI